MAQSPGSMCSAKPSLLLYANTAVFPQEIRQLNYSTFPPTETDIITRTGQNVVYDMCYVERESDDLVVITSCMKGIFAYRLGTDHLEWGLSSLQPDDRSQKKMNARGITVIDNRFLAVCDYANECIQMISKHGRYLGVAYPFRNKRSPDLIEWCSSTSCLLVTCQQHDSRSIHIIKVT